MKLMNTVSCQLRLCAAITLTALFSPGTTLIAQEQMRLDIYSMANTPVFTTNSFKTICAGKEGYLWAGTANQGLYKFNGTSWSKIANTLLNNNINDIKADEEGGIWIAQSGNTGAQAITGGIHYFPDTSSTTFTYFGATVGVPTRNTRGLYINNALINPANPRLRVWSANIGHITAGVSATGAVGRGNANTSSPFFNSIAAGIQTASGLGSIPAIGGNHSRIWAFAQNNYGRSTILIYNIGTGALVDSFNNLNSILPSNFVARAIYYDDVYARWWVGMVDGRIYVYENNIWKLAHFASAAVNTNAIAGDGEGHVYIGSQAGLIVYRGGDVTQYTSYKEYSTWHGLPSSNVQGIYVNHYSVQPGTYTLQRTILLATSAGIAVWRPANIEVSHIKHGNYLGRRERFEYSASDEIAITADSSISTLFKVRSFNANNYQFRISEDPAGAMKSLYGHIIPVAHNSDSLVAVMRHPSFADLPSGTLKRTMHLQVYDSVNQQVIDSFPIEIYRPPLLMVHGLWSSAASCFPAMRAALLAKDMYRSEMVSLANYPGADSFSKNLPKVKRSLDSLLTDVVVRNKISCGKADVTGHSMGGVLLRLYLQSRAYDTSRDINRLITLNTPHGGSTLPNFVLKSSNLDLRLALFFTKHNPSRGALYDLKVNSPGIKQSLNGPITLNGGLNRNNAPSHAIVTTLSVDALPTSSIMPPNIPGQVSVANLLFTLTRLYGLLTTGALFDNDEHDLIVRKASQQGGLSGSHITIIPDEHHVSSTGSLIVADSMAGLLNANPSGSRFTPTGFYPNGFIPLTFPQGYNRAARGGQMKTSAGTLDVTSPAAGSSVFTGASLTVNFTQTMMDTMIIALGTASGSLRAAYVTPPATSVTFPVPAEYYGPLTISMMGFNQGGFGAMDTVTVNVNTTATLQNILPNAAALRHPPGSRRTACARWIF